MFRPHLFYVSILLSLIVGIPCVLPSQVKAQAIGTTAVDFIVSPESPAPGDTVTIGTESTVADLNEATFLWQIDGRTIEKGTGLKSFTVTAPKLGGAVTVSVTITAPQFGSLKQNITIRSSSIDLVWQTNSYTPPFYQGKSLAGSESLVSLIALPTIIVKGATKKPGDLIYTWKKNGQVEGVWSGRGKNTYQFKAPVLSDDLPSIEVQAVDPDSGVTAHKTLNLSIVTPQIIFYESNPLLGLLLNQGFTNGLTLRQSEVTLFGAPYFFEGSTASNNNFTYAWQLNGTDVTNPSQEKNTITVRSPGGSGSSFLNLSIENVTKLLESASLGLTIQYGN